MSWGGLVGVVARDLTTYHVSVRVKPRHTGADIDMGEA